MAKKTKPVKQVKRQGDVRDAAGKMHRYRYVKEGEQFYLLIVSLEETEEKHESKQSKRVMKSVQTERLKREEGEDDKEYLKRVNILNKSDELPEGYELETVIEEREELETVPVITTKKVYKEGNEKRYDVFCNLIGNQVTQAVKNIVNS